MLSTRTVIAITVMATVLAFASGCRLVGSGTLGYVPTSQYGDFRQPAATSGSPVSVQIFSRDPDDTWPPPDALGVRIQAEDIPAIVNYTREPEWAHSLLLVRLFSPSEQADPQNTGVFRSCDELNNRPGALVDIWTRRHAYGPIFVNADEPVDALLTIDDTPENREGSWALTTGEVGWYSGGTAIRCGTITVMP